MESTQSSEDRMFARQLLLAFALCLILPSWEFAQTPPPAHPDASRIDALIRKLGSSSFVQREQARKELEAIGPSALDTLRLANKTTDAETSHRLTELIRRFEEQLLTKQILAPKEVHLKLNGVGVQQAITELANQSGYPIQFLGDATKFADKKITLDEKMPFWQALDKLCEQAGLMERVDLASQVAPGITEFGGKNVMRRIQTFPPAPMPAGPIVLIHRGNEKSHVSYAGAIKAEVRISRHVAAKELNVMLIVSSEPRLLNNTLVGRPILYKMLDNQGANLQPNLESPKLDGPMVAEAVHVLFDQQQLGNSRVAKIRVKEGEQPAKQIKELAGKLTMQVDLQNEKLAKIDNILQAAGKSVDAANGGTMKVLHVKKLDNGLIEVQASLENLAQNPFGGNVLINGNGAMIIRGNVIINGGNIRTIGRNSRDLPDLLDSKGQKLTLTGVSSDSVNFVNGSTARTATMLFQPTPSPAEPRELVLFGTRTHMVAVPFRFENLPLP
jgi:hypothetical protein